MKKMEWGLYDLPSLSSLLAYLFEFEFMYKGFDVYNQ